MFNSHVAGSLLDVHGRFRTIASYFVSSSRHLPVGMPGLPYPTSRGLAHSRLRTRSQSEERKSTSTRLALHEASDNKLHYLLIRLRRLMHPKGQGCQIQPSRDSSRHRSLTNANDVTPFTRGIATKPFNAHCLWLPATSKRGVKPTDYGSYPPSPSSYASFGHLVAASKPD